MKQLILSFLVLLMLAGCGGTEKVEQAASKPKANNPLASQQQLIRDAKAVQGILDQNAAKKKAAIGEIN